MGRKVLLSSSHQDAVLTLYFNFELLPFTSVRKLNEDDLLAKLYELQLLGNNPDEPINHTTEQT